MCDPRFPDDTLFLYFESDFRFWETDDMDPTEWLPLVVGGAKQWVPKGTGASSSANASGSRTPPSAAAASSSVYPREADKPGKEEKVEEKYSNLKFAKMSKYEKVPGLTRTPVAPEVLDMVLTANIASRKRAGDLIWYGWNAADAGQKAKQPHRISFGSQCIGFTKRSATLCLALMEKEKPMHFDLWLKWHLESQHGSLDADTMEASYVVPPIGGFASHKSPNLKDEVRAGLWSAHWAAEGSVRDLDKHLQPRRLLRFHSGDRRHLEVVDILNLREADMSLVWKTGLPPNLADGGSHVLWPLIQAVDYGNSLTEQYWGPQYNAREWKLWNQGNPNWEAAELKLMRNDPDGSEQPTMKVGGAVRTPPSRLVIEVATLQLGAINRDTERSQRLRRIAKSNYKKRFFVQDESQAEKHAHVYMRSTLHVCFCACVLRRRTTVALYAWRRTVSDLFSLVLFLNKKCTSQSRQADVSWHQPCEVDFQPDHRRIPEFAIVCLETLSDELDIRMHSADKPIEVHDLDMGHALYPYTRFSKEDIANMERIANK